MSIEETPVDIAADAEEAATAGRRAGAAAGQRGTQRARLLAAMSDVAAREGYARASIAKVIAQAGVSRPTFYEYFANKDDCVVASAHAVADGLLQDVGRAVAAAAPEQALQSTVAALVAFAASEVEPARLLMVEMLAGGARTLDERDRVIAEVARRVDDRYEALSPETVVADLSSRIVVGGVWRMLSTRLRSDEPDLSGLAEDLERWIELYDQPAGKHRWRTLAPSEAVVSSPPLVSVAPLRAPAPLGRGRPRMSKAEVAENHRRRILAATAEVAKSKGYTAATIADITRLADVDVRVFHRLFTGKQDAFLAAHELGLQSTMAQAAAAFFGGASWPERVWEAGRAFTGFLEANPLIAHLGFVEAYAVGGESVKRIEDSHAGFTIFLQEAYQAYPQDTPPSRVALDAIATTVFEIAYRLTREERQHGMAGLLANMVDLALTPFMGSAEANRFIDRKLEDAAG